MWNQKIYSTIITINQIVKSIKKQKLLITAVNKLNKGELINFDRFPHVDLRSIFNLFVKLGWSKQYDSDKQNYTHLLTDCKVVENDIDNIISSIINKTPDLKRFLLVHSTFHIEERDWLENLMLKILLPNQLDIEWYLTEPTIPDKWLKKLSIFEPEPYQELRDNVIVTYKMWGQFALGEQVDPIAITDLDWDRISKESDADYNSIKEHAVVDIKKIMEEQEELPF